jgi:hypothetical protein
MSCTVAGEGRARRNRKRRIHLSSLVKATRAATPLDGAKKSSARLVKNQDRK